MINLKYLGEKYEDYKTRKEKLEECESKLAEYKNRHEEEIEYLYATYKATENSSKEKAYHEKHGIRLNRIFRKDNEILNNYINLLNNKDELIEEVRATTAFDSFLSEEFDR